MAAKKTGAKKERREEGGVRRPPQEGRREEWWPKEGRIRAKKTQEGAKPPERCVPNAMTLAPVGAWV